MSDEIDMRDSTLPLNYEDALLEILRLKAKLEDTQKKWAKAVERRVLDNRSLAAELAYVKKPCSCKSFQQIKREAEHEEYKKSTAKFVALLNKLETKIHHEKCVGLHCDGCDRCEFIGLDGPCGCYGESKP